MKEVHIVIKEKVSINTVSNTCFVFMLKKLKNKNPEELNLG